MGSVSGSAAKALSVDLVIGCIYSECVELSIICDSNAARMA